MKWKYYLKYKKKTLFLVRYPIETTRKKRLSMCLAQLAYGKVTARNH